MSGGDRIGFWSDKWTNGITGWHLEDVNYGLARYGDDLLTSSSRRVFVPLCGKSIDLKWLYDKGHTVVGVEGVEQPILEFLTEHKLAYTVEELTWGKLYKTDDGRLSIYCCDLLKVNVEAVGKFDSLWDRGSLVAIYEKDRESYASLLKSLLKPDFRYLLSTVIYTPTETFNGPPRNIPTELVEELFGDVCKVKTLEINRYEENRWGLDYMAEVLLLLAPKN